MGNRKGQATCLDGRGRPKQGYMQLATPSAPAKAVSMAMTILSRSFQLASFILFRVSG